jgi:hypothetical protein
VTTRYRKLNVWAFDAHGTVEFRLHQGTLNAERAVAWVRLVVGFVNVFAVAKSMPNPSDDRFENVSGLAAVDGMLKGLRRFLKLDTGTVKYLRARARKFEAQRAA